MVRIALLMILYCVPAGSVAQPIFADGFEDVTNRALRFFGNGVNDIDRVKIRIDDPATDEPGPPVDVGATDFTIEFWLKAEPGDNDAAAISCGNNNNWILGNIVIDRDRFNQGQAYGLSIAGRTLVWGIDGESASHTICGSTVIDDGAWHHVAVQRRETDGRMDLYVDGVLDAQGFGPGGDVSYPDDGVPGDYCGGPCVNSDPFVVLGAEKHDAGPAYPSYAGFVDELRYSTTLRYAAEFTPPAAGFAPDADTVGLYHFDEPGGTAILDSSGVGPSDGELRFGGMPAGPLRVPSDAPTEPP